MRLEIHAPTDGGTRSEDVASFLRMARRQIKTLIPAARGVDSGIRVGGKFVRGEFSVRSAGRSAAGGQEFVMTFARPMDSAAYHFCRQTGPATVQPIDLALPNHEDGGGK
jgi:hypothetical protein